MICKKCEVTGRQSSCPDCGGAGLIAPITWKEYTDMCKITAFGMVVMHLDTGQVLVNSKTGEESPIMRPISWVYPITKLCGESQELVEAAYVYNDSLSIGDGPEDLDHGDPDYQKDMVKELGDVMWYTAILADALNIDIGDLRLDYKQSPYSFEDQSQQLQDRACVISELLGKALRDDAGAITPNRKALLRNELCNIQDCAGELVPCGLTLGDVLLTNLRKTCDRKERGVLRGGGNDR